MAFHEVDAHELTLRPFDAFDRGWALLAAGDDAASNCMTISWGGLGTLWNKPVATAYVRQSRYTKQFLDGSDTFSVNLFDGTASWARCLAATATSSRRRTSRSRW